MISTTNAQGKPKAVGWNERLEPMTNLNDDNMNMNLVLCEMFGIPPDALGATIRLRAGAIPTITIHRLIYRTGQLAPGATSARFEIVQKKPSNATLRNAAAEKGEGNAVVHDSGCYAGC